MRSVLECLLAGSLWMVTLAAARAQDAGAPPPEKAVEPLPQEYSCMFCHGADGTLAGDEQTKHLIVTEKMLTADIHWQKGLRCHDCHGGKPVLDEYVDHRDDPEFLARVIATPADIPGFCGRCHSDLVYMRRYEPSARTDQESEYWTSGHGERLKQEAEKYKQALAAQAKEKPAEAKEKPAEAEEKKEGEGEGEGAAVVFDHPKVANCVSCHGHHGILAVDDPNSPVYPTRVADTCSHCHSDPKAMVGLTYRGRPFGHDQYKLWRESVHGQALMDKGDLSAPTCNDCHGNHGAMPPGVDSVANACGTCHGKVAKLFTETRMAHKFEEVGLPGCAECHGAHRISQPTDQMLGMGQAAVCGKCHEQGRYGATLAGAEAARAMRQDMDRLKQEIAEAEDKIKQAERLGMEVRGPRFDLRQAFDALTNARSMIHTFARDPVEKVLAEGLQTTAAVEGRADAALREHTARRVWLAASLVPILIVVVLLLLYIRTLPPPRQTTDPPPSK